MPLTVHVKVHYMPYSYLSLTFFVRNDIILTRAFMFEKSQIIIVGDNFCLLAEVYGSPLSSDEITVIIFAFDRP